MKCNGECKREGRCKGEVKKVLVTGNGFFKPFEFCYCETAVNEDRRRGFNVDFINEHADS